MVRHSGMEKQNRMFAGMRSFMIVWVGQLASLTGSAMTRFALLIWMWDLTGEATAVVLVGAVTGLASTAANLFAGSVVDRFSRKSVIIAGDTGAGFTTLGLLLLLQSDHLLLWHLYAASVFYGVFATFHGLAFSAAITTMIPKTQYARASGLQSLAHYTSVIGAPALAGLLLSLIDIIGVMLVDLLTFSVAMLTVFSVIIPNPEPEQTPAGETSFFRRTAFGIRYILARPGLFGIMLIYLAFETFESFCYPLIAPMILARTGSNEVILGMVQAAAGLGGVLGGLGMSIWGGPRRKIHGLLLGLLFTGLLGDALMGVGRGVLIWLVASFCLECFIPMAIGSGQAIWQSKVEPALQGRVFAARSLVTGAVGPIAILAGGLLSDHVFEPMMSRSGTGADLFDWLVGTGPGAGMALLLVICGILSGLVGLAGYVSVHVREVEDRLPDHDLAGVTTA